MLTGSYTITMPTTVRIKPEIITAHRLRIEMFGLEEEDIENTIRMKGWAWVLARRGWVYAGEPDFIYRQIREVIIALPDITFETDAIEESVKTVLQKARTEEEREQGRLLLRKAFEKTGQLAAAEGFLETPGLSPWGEPHPPLAVPRLLLAVAVVLENGLLQLGVGGVECRREHRGALYGVPVHLQLHRAVEVPPARLIRQDQGLDGDQVVVTLSLPPQPVLGYHIDKAQVPLVFVHEEVGHVPELVVRGIEDASATQVVVRACGVLVFLQPDDVHGHSSLLEPAFPRAGRSRTNIRLASGQYNDLEHELRVTPSLCRRPSLVLRFAEGVDTELATMASQLPALPTGAGRDAIRARRRQAA